MLMGTSYAAIPKESLAPQSSNKVKALKTKHEEEPSQEQIELTIMALRLPMDNRMQTLKKRGHRAFSTLRFLSFDETQSLQVRWRSITALSKLFPDEAKADLERALNSSLWFMRNAALLGSVYMDKSVALKWAEQALSDRALVVRTAAVQVIEKLGVGILRARLWEELYKPHNFRLGQGLWVRKYIVRTLAKDPQKKEWPRFLRLLKEDEKPLYPFAIQALHKVTGAKNVASKKSLLEQRQTWLRWGKGSQAL
jgi:HEAT repeat protein